ncbi:MAG: cytochrome P450, partial [Chloroflexota bacterium]
MNNTHLKIPPDVSGLPIVGRAFDFLRANGIPLDVLRRLHEEHGDVVRFNVMNRPFHLVVNPELTHEILVKRISEFPKPSAVTDQSMGITRFLGMGILTAGYDEWKPQRKLMQPFMHRTHIESYADTMGALGEKLLDTWQDDSERNIHSDMHKVTMWIIAKTVFDLDVDELQDFEAIVKEIQQIILDDMISFLPAKLSGRDAKAARLNDTLTAFVDEMIAKRKVDTVRAGDDLLSLLLATTDEAGQALSDTFIRDNILTMFFAGHETTANTLTWAFYYLSQNPDVLATLQAEVDTVLADGRTPTLADLPDLPYTLMVIKETMRIQPTIPVIPRALPKTTMLGDYQYKTRCFYV